MMQLNYNIKNYPKVSLSYSNPTPVGQRIKIQSYTDAFELIRSTWNEETIDHIETFKTVLINRNNHVLGIHEVAFGGRSGVLVDIAVILQAALLANSSSILLSHNHPSGQLLPSDEDLKITQRIHDAAKLFDIYVFDHIIVSSSETDFYSFAENGKMPT